MQRYEHMSAFCEHIWPRNQKDTAPNMTASVFMRRKFLCEYGKNFETVVCIFWFFFLLLSWANRVRYWEFVSERIAYSYKWDKPHFVFSLIPDLSHNPISNGFRFGAFIDKLNNPLSVMPSLMANFSLHDSCRDRFRYRGPAELPGAVTDAGIIRSGATHIALRWRSLAHVKMAFVFWPIRRHYTRFV